MREVLGVRKRDREGREREGQGGGRKRWERREGKQGKRREN